MATVVLVHGAGAGSWIWRWVTPPLRERGHDVFTITMTGSGDRHHLLTSQITLETNVADVINGIVFEDLNECVVVGHSQVGAVLPGVGAAISERLSRLVFLDAVLVRRGESIAAAAGLLTDRQCRDIADKVRRGETPAELDISEQQRAAPADMKVECDPTRLEWMFARLNGVPALTMVEPVQVGSEAVSLPADYVACSPSPMTRFHQRAAELNWNVEHIDSDHALMVSEPEKTAAFLHDLMLRARPV